MSLTINKQTNKEISARIEGISNGIGKGKKEEDKEKKCTSWKAQYILRQKVNMVSNVRRNKLKGDIWCHLCCGEQAFPAMCLMY